MFSAIGEDGVIGYIAHTSLNKYAILLQALFPSTIFILSPSINYTIKKDK